MASGGLGYEIGASLANDAASATDPFEEDPTTIIFGNADNPSLDANQTPTLTSTATATTALPGGSATSSTPVATNTPMGVGYGSSTLYPQTTSTGLSLTTILLIAGAAFVAWHFLKK